jgi:thiol-disulfide isomerase/thioredoxin
MCGICLVCNKNPQTEKNAKAIDDSVNISKGRSDLLISGKIIHVPLENKTTLDDPPGHLEVFRPTPIIPVKLPSVDTTGARFIKIYSYWKTQKGRYLVVMILPKPTGELLYIDLNYNNDLTDDGPPRLFLSTENEFQFDMINNDDPQQMIRLVYIRVPTIKHNDHKADFIDAQGNLTAKLLHNVLQYEDFTDFYGKVGTFYWDDRITVRRGTVTVDGKKYLIGLQDFTYNGLYNDRGDLLYVDRNGTGKLKIFGTNSKCSIGDTFSIGSKYFRLAEIDKYGKWVDLESVRSEGTYYYIQQFDSSNAEGFSFGSIDTAWKQIAHQSLDGKQIELRSYHGKYVLLNFWGEWCKPCIDEIPKLKELLRNTPQSKVQIISFLNYNTIEKAKKIIKDSTLSWPQIILTDELKSKFKIDMTGFPTNIVILPNGREAIVTGNLINTSLSRYIQ